MADQQDRIRELLEKIEALSKKQADVSEEIANLKQQIEDYAIFEIDLEPAVQNPKISSKAKPVIKKEVNVVHPASQEKPIPLVNTAIASKESSFKLPEGKNSLEKFIGENLLNKIGILVLIIGVSIGTKYAIDNDIISPLGRIILGYLLGAGLMGVAAYLKKNYHSFSAVLASGALAIMYFVTYAAFSYYNLFPQSMAFSLMLLFTAFGVFAAIHYDKQIIAHIGLVGAYAIPFLVGDEGSMLVLFSYVAIVNLGILFLCVRKNWKFLFLNAFVFTTLIFAAWLFEKFKAPDDTNIAILFASIFYLIFYLALIGYNIYKDKKLAPLTLIFIIINAFVYYGSGDFIFSETNALDTYRGPFAIANAIVHFAVAGFIYYRKLGGKLLLLIVVSLVLTFITIAVPIQLDGLYVSLSWVIMASFLFWAGRSQKEILLEIFGIGLFILAFFSLMEDWEAYKYLEETSSINPIFNVRFLINIIFVAASSFLYYVHKRYHFENNFDVQFLNPRTLLDFLFPSVIIFVLYVSGFMEIDEYFSNLMQSNPRNYSYRHFINVWYCNYTMVFCSIGTLINIYLYNNKFSNYVNIILNGIAIFAFLVIGLYELSTLRDAFLDQKIEAYYFASQFHIYIRYISLALLGILMYLTYQLVKRNDYIKIFSIPLELISYGILLWVLSSELLHWLQLSNVLGSNKLGLSILFGIYALGLIVLGIWQNKRYLRISAIILFALTLVKLFFYDIAHLSTISKTIVFVSLGLLLLIISFLYNKYTKNIFNEEA